MRATASPIITADVAEVLGRDLPWAELAGTIILVTGASGMLPSYVVHTLLALNDREGAGVTVLGLVRNEQKARRVLTGVLDRPDFRLLIQDVAAPLDLPDAVDWVVHGATPARPALHSADPVGTIKANVLGAFNLLELAVAKGSRGFVLMSSAEVYGDQPAGTELITEQSYGGLDILNTRACYSEGKRAAETIAAVYQAQYGISCRIVRFGHVYGPGMALDDGRVQADFAANVVAGTDIILNSDGSAVRTYTYVADAIAGLFYAMLQGSDAVYNVADIRGLVSIRELATSFTQVRPDKGLRLVFTKDADARAYNPVKGQGLDSSRLAALGWRPVVDLATGLDRMVTDLEAADEPTRP